MTPTAAMNQTFVRFNDLTTLLRAMSASTLRNSLFPRDIHVGQDDGAVYVALAPQLATHLQLLSRGAGWAMAAESPPATAIRRPLADLLAPRLVRFDENRRVTREGCYAENYLLGAATFEEAQEILRILTASQIPGITARWVNDLRADSGDVPSAGSHPPARPARFFWSVSAYPPTAAAKQACGMWHGPVTVSHRHCRIYLEHPFDMPGDKTWMKAVDWGPERAAILLGVSSPRQTAINLAASQPFLQELIQVADIAPLDGPQVVVAEEPPAAPRFSVAMRLSRDSERRSESQVIADLERDLEARRQALQRLKRKHSGDADQPWSTTYEPLFIYFEEQGRLPRELHRLLVECCDHGVLDTLLYAAVDAGPFADWGAAADQIAHFLVPRSALGKPVRDGANLWLREYAPASGQPFQLQISWSAYGLRMFLPESDRHLRLYPDFTPGPVAARKIGEALAAPDEAGSGMLHLLFERPAGGLVARSLRTSILRPFVDACPWRCAAIDSMSPTPIDSEIVAQQLKAMIGESLKQAIETATLTDIQAVKESLKSELERLEKVETRQQALHSAAVNVDQVVKDTKTDLLGLLSAIQANLNPRSRRAIEERLTSLDAQMARLQELQVRIQQLRTDD